MKKNRREKEREREILKNEKRIDFSHKMFFVSDRERREYPLRARAEITFQKKTRKLEEDREERGEEEEWGGH